jgi:hypothetical protein
MSTHSTTTPDSALPAAKATAGRTRWMIGGVACAILGAGVWLTIAASGSGEPRLNADTAAIAEFVHRGEFGTLSFDKQRQFYKVLDDRGKELEASFRAGQISEAQYRDALEGAWLGKHINQVEEYFSRPPGQARATYIDQLVTKKLKPKDKKQAVEKDEDEIKADETAAEARVDGWPPAIREQWKQFHTAYRTEKKRREKAATRPSGT